MTNELSSNPFAEEEVQVLSEKMAVWAGTLTPREQQYLVTQLSQLAAQEADDVSGHNFNRWDMPDVVKNLMGGLLDDIAGGIAGTGAAVSGVLSTLPSPRGAGPKGGGGRGGAGPAPA